MITILQVDKNYESHRNYDLLQQNLKQMDIHNNNHTLYVDKDHFISHMDLKIIKLLDILKQYPGDEVIMYLDAFDTRVESDDSEIENKFLSLDIDVLYSCEHNCWPYKGFSEFFTPTEYLNSGTMIFKNIKYQKILKMLISLYNGIEDWITDDQFYHSIFAMMKLSDVKIDLDKNREIFQCLWGENEFNFRKNGNRIENTTTSTFPCVFHGNGDGIMVLRNMFNGDIKKVKFLGFLSDKMGINFMNTSEENVKVRAEIKNIHGQVIFSDNLDLPQNISHYIHTSIKDNYIFTITDMNNNILLQEKN